MDRTRLYSPGTPAQLSALIRDPERDPGSAWVENGDEAALIVASVEGALDGEPPTLETVLPDGRRVTVAAAAVSIRFQRTAGGWEPTILQGVRVRSVTLDGYPLYEADDLTDETVQFLSGW